MSRALAFVIDRSLLLVAGTIAALMWANTWPASYHAFSASAVMLIDDVGMAFFFGLAVKEIAEATRPGGPLASPREAAVPLLAAAGGMLVPAAIYLIGVRFAGDPTLARGWAIPCATDIAFSYLVAQLVFPPKHPALPFLLLLAVADDALGLVILAVFYPTHAVAPLPFVGLMLPAVAFAWWLRRRSVPSFWPYVIVGGSLSWAALYFGGLHPALALVPIVPFMPCREAYHDLFEDHAVGASDTLNRFAAWWRVPVQIVLFFFGLVSAGVAISSVGLVTGLVTAALLIGKPAGVLLATLLAVAAGLRRPAGTTYGDIAIVGITAGIGFTVALFFATAAFPAGDTLDCAKMGALLSFGAAPLAIAGSRYRARRLRRA